MCVIEMRRITLVYFAQVFTYRPMTLFKFNEDEFNFVWGLHNNNKKNTIATLKPLKSG